VRIKELSFLQITMSSSYEYSLRFELEYSHVDIFMIYELEYSPYVMFISYSAQCFIVHTMFMNRFRLMLRWWFIMLSGYAQVLYLSICRVRDWGDLGGSYVCGRGA
jgi:hypothetical protein